MIRQFWSRQFVNFVIVGATAALFNFASRLVFDIWLSFSVSIVLAYMVGMLTAFSLSRIFVFKGSILSVQQSAMYFTLVNILALMQTWLVSLGMAYYVLPAAGIDYRVKEISHAVGIVVPVFTSFLGHKYFSFR